MSKKLWVGPYDLMQATGDVPAYLAKVKDAGATGVRIFGVIAWGYRNELQPWKEMKNGKYNLDKWNVEYWDKLNRLLELLELNRLDIHVALHDYCSIKQVEWQYHPFLNNKQGVEFFPREAEIYHERYFSAMTYVTQLHGVRYWYEPMNETGPREALDWHRWAVATLRKFGVPQNRIIGSGETAYDDDFISNLSKQVRTWSVHGHARPQAVLEKYPNVHSKNIIISTDGGRDGKGPADPVYGWRGPNKAQMANIARKVIEHGHLGIEYKPRDAVTGRYIWADVDKVDVSIIRAAGRVFE